MSGLFDEFGGTTGTLGRSREAEVLRSKGNPFVAAPIICYESIYADYVSSYVRKGANVLTVVTNDGWWGNTPGHRQHMSMARLRAIENRRWVLRSANTGISCFIDPAGNVLQPQPWEKQAAIKMAVAPLNELTFFSKHGDWMSRLIWPMALLLLAYALVKRIIGRKNRL
jgi:apolipoprotein N-acyltransferase